MEREGFVSVSIRDSDLDSPSRDIQLGECHAVWGGDGVSIGSDPGCTVVLSGLAPVAARVVAASNHKLLYFLPEGTSLPLPPVTRPIGHYDQRVDSREFQVGRYMIRFAEVYREG